MTLSDPVTILKNVGPKRAKLLNKLGITSVQDLLYFMPKAYEAQGICAKVHELKEGETYSITAKIIYEPGFKRIHKGLSLTTFSLQDETGRVEAVFFNQPYIGKRCIERAIMSMSPERSSGLADGLQFTNPIHGKGRSAITRASDPGVCADCRG